MKTKQVLFTIILSLFIPSKMLNGVETKVVLTSRFLQIIDGALLTGEIAGITLQIRKKLIEMTEGKRQTDGTYEGAYTVDQRKHSIHALADLETEISDTKELLVAKLKTVQTEDEKREISYKLASIENQMTELNKLLETAKKDFQEAVCVFLCHARTVKEPISNLISEYCEKANRQNSLLLDWAKINGEGEEESFNKQVTSFNIFYNFVSDLANFLEALIRGCPKAQQQFKKIMLDKSKRTVNN